MLITRSLDNSCQNDRSYIRYMYKHRSSLFSFPPAKKEIIYSQNITVSINEDKKKAGRQKTTVITRSKNN